MPRDLRKLFFSDDELMDTIEAHDDMASQRLEEQKITAVKPFARDDGSFEITLEGELSTGGNMVELPPFYIVAAMMRFCIEEGIPLPRRGNKSLNVEDGTVVLIVDVPDQHDTQAEEEAA